MRRPESSDYDAFYAGYVSRVPDGDILELLESEGEATRTLCSSLSPAQADFRYRQDKWSVKEVIGHVTDAERMFAYRAHAFARRDPAELPSFDQDVYARHSNASRRSMEALVSELRAVRNASLALFRGLDEEMWSNRGVGSGCEFTVGALAYIILGHELHHRAVLEERYLGA